MNDRTLKSFLTVADSGSFSKAEEESYLSKQALIRQIDTLEAELGFRLLTRDKRGVALTPAGSAFYEGAKRLLSEYDALTDRCRELAQARKVLRIANPPHAKLMLSDVMSEFARRYPDVHQEVLLRNGAQLINDLLSGRLDLGEHVLSDEIRRPELAFTPVSKDRYFCVMTKEHPLAGRQEILPEELHICPVGVLRENHRELVTQLRRRCSGLDIREQDAGESHTEAVFNLCLEGGIYITKEYYARSLEPLQAIPLAGDLLRESVIVYRADPSPETRAFVALLCEMHAET